MSKTIVVGVDGSETAAGAARKAADLASALGADLYVITAFGKFEMERFSSGSEEFIYTNADDAERTAQAAITTLQSDHRGLKITAVASDGKPGEALVKAAERFKADIIVVGNKRVQGIARVLGSIARDVASRAPCDVYVAHTHTRQR